MQATCCQCLRGPTARAPVAPMAAAAPTGRAPPQTPNPTVLVAFRPGPRFGALQALPRSAVLPSLLPGRSWQGSPRSRRRCGGQSLVVAEVGAAAGHPNQANGPQQQQQRQQQQRKTSKRLDALLHPFSDPAANAKLLALCTAHVLGSEATLVSETYLGAFLHPSQMLGSVATLITETYLPVYLADVLHLSNTKIGNLQGTAQLLAKTSGFASGLLADLLSPGRMVVVGTALSALNKPMYAAAGYVAVVAGPAACAYWIFFAKIFDRVAKGIREAPSKALMGQLAAAGGDPPAAAFALRQSLATLGALGGALGAAAALRLTGYNYSLTFALSCAPAALSLMLVAAAFGRGGSGRQAAAKAASQPPATEPRILEATASADEAAADATEAAGAAVAAAGGGALGVLGKARIVLGALRPAYWQALATVALLYFARFDAGFAMLRAKAVMDRATLPVLIPCMMVTQAVMAAPMGVRAKASVASRNRVLLEGMAAMVAADACFALVPSAAGMVAGAFLLGVHMAMTHGVSLGMLASYIPSQPLPGLGPVAGTCWSCTDLLLGVVLAASNSIAGRLCDATAVRGLGGIGCFLGGASATALSMGALVLFSSFGELGKEELAQRPAKKQGGGTGGAAQAAAVGEETGGAVDERGDTVPVAAKE